MDRVIALVDMDCFYVQVEQRLLPETRGKPCIVVQYNHWKGGGIIAVGYEARAKGVRRGGMRADEAKELCPDIHVFRVPEKRGKANLSRYRDACVEVMEVLCTFSKCVERASVDEAYIDLTDEIDKKMEEIGDVDVSIDMLPNTFVVGWDGKENNDPNEEPPLESQTSGVFQWLNNCHSIEHKRLAIGAVIVEEMRKAVYQKTEFRCSAGVSHNKILAKLACGINKPNKQTVLPFESVEKLFKLIPVNKVRHLGGKLGQQLQDELGMQYMGDICKFTEKELQIKLGDKTG
ncbi:DNA polymerase eta-like, partial [Saccoglossus kowalevskii]|uniref:DNA polymerase eta-like n=1 Tax=Saccoglossus kowalevskii TaxID=10224 RepID=A0ABM0H1H6_SACKO